MNIPDSFKFINSTNTHNGPSKEEVLRLLAVGVFQRKVRGVCLGCVLLTIPFISLLEH